MRSSSLAALALLAVLAPSRARAGNDDAVLLGNEAAMTGGAVSAVVSDGSATWYNPAGIAAVDRDTLDLSGSATMLRIADTPGLLRSATGAQANGGYYEFLGIPSAVTLVRRLDCITSLGLGIFVPQLTGHTDRVGLEELTPDYLARFQLTQQESSSTYYGGITLGVALAPNLRIGVTLYGTYRQFALTTQFFGGAERDGEDVFAFGVGSLTSVQSVSIEVGAGIQWELVPGVHFGASLRSPGLLLGSAFHVTSSTFMGGPDGLDLDITAGSGLEPRIDMVTPARLRVGLAYRWDGGWIGIDGDVQHALVRPAIGVNREWVGGVRIGGRVQIDPSLSMGAGLFTDLDATRAVGDYGQTQIDFFGGTYGLELRNPHRLGEGENAADIVFVNTFALRYAVGVGRIGGLRFDTAADMGEGISIIEVDTQVHEISLHLGSALYF
ncbi:Hypothetical protein I5071_84670 [Sandaracinus amylolyticus]|nr:Hypothetical protein I5071_84670 [Sandaracinus amylolyticus]